MSPLELLRIRAIEELEKDEVDLETSHKLRQEVARERDQILARLEMLDIHVNVMTDRRVG